MDKYHHHIHIHRFIHNKYNELVISNTFRTFALSLISLFLPIFLLQSGFTMLEVLVLEVVISITVFFGHYIAHGLVGHGIKKHLIASYVLTIIFYIFLYNTEFLVATIGKIGYLTILAVLNTMYIALFWTSFHLFFIKSTRKNEGKKYGILMGIPVILGIVSPFVGSLLIGNFGFQVTFIVTSVLLAIGGSTLFFSKETKASTKRDMKKIIKGSGVKANWMFIFEGANTCGTAFIWPVLLYVLGMKLISLGLLYLFSNSLFAIVSYLSGKITDKHGARKIIRIGSIGHGISLILRAFTKTMLLMTFAQSLGGLFGALLFVPFRSSFYKHSHKDSSNSILNREFYLHVGRVCLFTGIIALYFAFGIQTALITSLIISGVLTFGFSVLVPEDTIKMKEIN